MILSIKAFQKKLSNRDLIKNDLNMKHEVFICQCNSVEHQMIASYIPDDKEVYISIHLIPEWKLWDRIKMAIKYIFGYKCQYGHFDEFIFNKNDADKLQSIVNYLKY